MQASSIISRLDTLTFKSEAPTQWCILLTVDETVYLEGRARFSTMVTALEFQTVPDAEASSGKLKKVILRAGQKSSPARLAPACMR